LWFNLSMETETAAREDLATLSREELTRKYMSAMQEKEELADRLRTAAIEKDEMASQINWLREQLNVLRTRKFSKNSEQVSSLQISLFNEAEDTLDHALPEDLSEDEITKAVPAACQSKRSIMN